jgi:hypothetical protein
LEGKKAEETPPRKSTSRTLKWVGQQYPGDLCAPEIGLANHLVRLEQEAWGDGQTERLGGLEINHQFELRRLFERQIRRFRTFQNFVDVHRLTVCPSFDPRCIT